MSDVSFLLTQTINIEIALFCFVLQVCNLTLKHLRTLPTFVYLRPWGGANCYSVCVFAQVGGVTASPELSSPVFPVAAVVAIVIGVFVFLIVLLLLIRKCLQVSPCSLINQRISISRFFPALIIRLEALRVLGAPRSVAMATVSAGTAAGAWLRG